MRRAAMRCASSSALERMRSPQELRVGTLNLRSLNADVKDVATAIIQHGGPLDVLAVQEVDTRWNDRLDRLADLLRMRVAVVAEADPFVALSNALLVTEATEATAHEPCTLDCYDPESRVAVALTLGPRMPHVVCTHLDHRAESVRLAQLEQLRVHAEALGSRSSLKSLPMLLLGDLNALRRADYSDAQWAALVSKRAEHGIKSATELTDTLERRADQGGWGWSDCRDVALCNGRTVTGDLATSVYGARVDYIWASPAMLRDWDVCEVSHVDVAQMHAPDAFTDHALVTCTLSRR